METEHSRDLPDNQQIHHEGLLVNFAILVIIMISRIYKYGMIVALLTSLSCKKEEIDSDLTFSTTCNFSGSKLDRVGTLSGSLTYTNVISGTPLSVNIFVIESPGLLPMVVCNMPPNLEMEKDQPKIITFSGRVVILPNEVDALNTDIELNFLKFEKPMEN